MEQRRVVGHARGNSSWFRERTRWYEIQWEHARLLKVSYQLVAILALEGTCLLHQAVNRELRIVFRVDRDPIA
jgi:hypothetical protein